VLGSGTPLEAAARRKSELASSILPLAASHGIDSGSNLFQQRTNRLKLQDVYSTAVPLVLCQKRARDSPSKTEAVSQTTISDFYFSGNKSR
jgi:hypothetical protein